MAPDHRIADPDAPDVRKAIDLMERESKALPRAGSRHALFNAFVLTLAALGIGFGATVLYAPHLIERGIAAMRGAPAETPATAVPTVTKASPPQKESKAVLPEPAAAPPPTIFAAATERSASAGASAQTSQPTAAAGEESKPVAAPELPAPAPAPAPASVPASAPERPRVATRAESKPAKPKPAVRPAQLVLAVSPKGELYVDGVHQGTAPFRTTFDLQPGLRRIEIRSPSHKPYVTYMTVEAGESRRIRHDFDRPDIRPPG